MGWKEDNKGSGPWPFAEQPNKWGYLNNPRWMNPPGTPVSYDGREDEEPQIYDIETESKISDKTSEPMHTHIPCGHWHKKGSFEIIVPPIEADLYGVLDNNAEVWAAHFSEATETLSYSGHYVSPSGDANCILLLSNSLLIVGGNGATAQLRTLTLLPDGTGHLTLIASYPIFNQYDANGTIGGVLVDAGDKIFYVQSDYPTIVVIDKNSLTRLARGFHCTVVNGTDGNIYFYSAPYYGWPALFYRPITGVNWNLRWDIVADDICDGPVVDWGVGYCVSGPGSQVPARYNSGYLFVGSWTSPNGSLKKIDPDTLAIDSYMSSGVATQIPYRIRCGNGRVYTACGTFTATVISYNISDLSLSASVSLPSGRFSGMNAGDIKIAGGFLIAATATYVSSLATIYLLDLDTLTIVDSVLSYKSCQRLCVISDRYIALGYNDGVCVYEIPTLRLVDDLDMTFLTGFSQREIVSRITN